MLTLARLHDRAEIFYSLQGEGRDLGRPSVFVRLANCNLHCIWCDTDYTWNWKGTRFAHQRDAEPDYEKYDRASWTLDQTIEEVAEQIAAFDCRNVILTGGEPLLQDEACADLMASLRRRDPAYRFSVETNGTIVPCPDFDAQIDQYNVSPKLANSNNARSLREKPRALQFFASHPKAWLKFVITQPQDLDEVLELVTRYRLSPHRVYLMPEGTEAEALQQRQQWLVEACKEHGLLFSDRLHVKLYGARRGV